MSDPLDSRPRGRAKRELAHRLRQVRLELYGEHGGPELARLLAIPAGTWFHYEGGVTIPGEVLLERLDLTGVEPRWLLRGEEAIFRSPSGEGARQPALEGASYPRMDRVFSCTIRPTIGMRI